VPNPTTGIAFSASTPAAPAGYQIATPQTNGAQPLSRFTFSTPNTGGAVVHTGNYTAVAADSGTLLSFSDSSPVSAHTLTLPSTPPFAKWRVSVQNTGTAVLTVNRNGLLIDTVAANLTLNQASGVEIFTDGTNYFTERGGGVGLAAIAGVQDETYTYSADTGTANAYAQTLTPTPTVVAGLSGKFKAAHANTGASTHTVAGTTAPLVKNGTQPLVLGDIAAGQIIGWTYDGTNYQTGGIAPATVSLNLIRGSSAPTFGTYSGSTLATVTVPFPTGSQAGDSCLMLVAAEGGLGSPGPVTPSGWTNLYIGGSSGWGESLFRRP
jgi:hypothetical protein